MAVSQIEEKILGRLARQAAPTNALLSASLYQVLGLSILLSRKLYRARKQRKLDYTRDTKSLRLYHHIIWLAREGLSITEATILPYCQDEEQDPEYRVMAAKLRASLYHVFCLFHNHPPVGQLSSRSFGSSSPPSSGNTPRGRAEATDSNTPKQSPKSETDQAGSRRAGKAPFRDPIPSMTSETSYVTNPYATGNSQTPPIMRLAPGQSEVRKTPTRPPGLAPINISPTRAAASFLLPPLNFVPMAKEHFDTAQHLANDLLSPAHALRLAVSLEHAAFLWDCTKDYDQARRLSRRAIRNVYASSDGLDDEEFVDASALVQALGGIVRRASAESTPQPRAASEASPPVIQQQTRNVPAPPTTRTGQPIVDRTIAVSPAGNRVPPSSGGQQQYHQPMARANLVRTPDRLSTVHEVDSVVDSQGTIAPFSPAISRLSSHHSQQQSSSRRNTVSSITSSSSDPNKAAKRRAVERAEEMAIQRQRTRSNASNASSTQRSTGSRQATPSEGHGNRGESRSPAKTTTNTTKTTSMTPPTEHEDPRIDSLPSDRLIDGHESMMTTLRNDRQRAVLDALRIMTLSVSPRPSMQMMKEGRKKKSRKGHHQALNLRVM